MNTNDVLTKLKAEIERRRLQNRYIDTDGYEQELFEIIDSLQQEQQEEPDKSLEEAAEKSSTQYYKDAGYSPFPNVETAAHKSGFKAGAEWQAEKCDEETSKLLYAERQTAYINGWHDCKEQMLKDAVEGTVMDFSSNQPRPQVDVLLDTHKYHTGDKVRIIVLKAEEE